jgi:type IV pilus assembly protein PilY1
VQNGNGNYLDNSDSRLNVAKEAILATYNNYKNAAQFGLMDLGVSGDSLYSTWVYYMSPLSQPFIFGGSKTSIPSGYSAAVNNPCYNNSSNSCSTIQQVLHNSYNIYGVKSEPYMYIGASSDNVDINDVLYAGYLQFSNNVLSYSFPGYRDVNPSNPFPPNYNLGDYEVGGVSETYPYSTDGLSTTGPTNAGYVPYSEMVWYALRGFGYDANPTNQGNLVSSVQTSTSTQASDWSQYLGPESSNPSNLAIKASAVNNSMAGALGTALDYFSGTNGYTAPPSNNGCTPAGQYVVLVTDGLPTWDLNGHAFPPLGSASGNAYGLTATFSATNQLLSTNDNALQDTINQIAALNAAGIKTYVVGLGAGVDPSINPLAYQSLQAMAVAGGTNTAFPATSAAAVSQDLGVILAQIEAQTLSSTTVAQATTSGSGIGQIFQASFSAPAWTGSLVAETTSVATNPTTGIPALGITSTSWNAAVSANLPIATTAPTSSTNPDLTGVPFTWNSLSTQEQSDLETAWPTLTSSQQSQFTNETAYGGAVLGYIAGSNAYTSAGSDANPVFRSRTTLLGDIIDSDPTYAGAPLSAYLDPTFAAFASQQRANLAAGTMPSMVYVGANDGMLHAFNAATGVQQFAFIPNGGTNGVFQNLYQLSEPTYGNTQHLYYVDGKITVGSVPEKNTNYPGFVPANGGDTWNRVLVSGEGDGGQSVFALNVTNPQSLTNSSAVANAVLWEFTDPNLGYTFGRPVIARIPYLGGTVFAAIFASGYNNSSSTPYLYILNAMNGSELDPPINLCSYDTQTCNSGMPNGAAYPTVASTYGNGVDNYVFLGDLQGNMWQINLAALNPPTGSTSSSPPVSLLFKTQSLSATVNGATVTIPQPITTAPVVTYNPAYPAQPGLFLIFGTGQLLQQSDLRNIQTQSMYGIWVQPGSPTVTLNQLKQQTLAGASSSSGQSIYVATNAAFSLGTQSGGYLGWYFNLPGSGSRLINNPLLYFGKVIATTYQPTPNVCGSGGTSSLLVFNYATGSSFATPSLFLNGLGLFTNSPSTGYGANAVGVNLGAGYAPTPTMLGNNIAVGNKVGTYQTTKGNTHPIYWRLPYAP